MSAYPLETRQLDAVRLRVLLTLARDLFQADDAGDSLALVARTLADTTRCDSALLLVRGARLDLVGFDAHGGVRPATADHPLHDIGIALLPDPTGHAGTLAGGGRCEHVGARTLALAIPAPAAIAVLAAAWDHDLDIVERETCRRMLAAILELGAAALGKIEARSVLEQIVGNQRDELASTSLAHAQELLRRDEAQTETQLLSMTDVLTGLYNRRGFFFQAEQVFKVSRRARTKSAVIFADVDGLKQVNDQLGHDAGDHLLRDAASVFRQSFRQADVVSRLGGDEFVAYTLDDEQPAVIVTRIRDNLRAFNLMRERPYAVSMSVGIVPCDTAGERTLSDYVVLADEYMYTHKRGHLH